MHNIQVKKMLKFKYRIIKNDVKQSCQYCKITLVYCNLTAISDVFSHSSKHRPAKKCLSELKNQYVFLGCFMPVDFVSMVLTVSV